MAYEKKLCVLKQKKRGFSADGGDLTGAVYLERMGDTLTVTPRLLGIAPVKEGRYALAVRVRDRAYMFDVSEDPPYIGQACPELSGGFAVLLCFVRGEVTPIAYGACGRAATEEEMLALFSVQPEKKKRAAKVQGAPVSEESAAGSGPSEKKEAPCPEETQETGKQVRDYRDDVIAEENYYERDMPGAGAEDAAASAGSEKKEKADAGGRGAGADAGDGVVQPFLFARAPEYYMEIRGKIEEIAANFPQDTRLRAVFPQSDWWDRGDSLFGVVYESGLPKYLCIAVRAEGEAPEPLRGKCTFVPASPFTEEEGWYVAFQSAETGEEIILPKA